MTGIAIALSLAAAAMVLFVALGGLQSRTSLVTFVIAMIAGVTLAFLARRRPRQ